MIARVTPTEGATVNGLSCVDGVVELSDGTTSFTATATGAASLTVTVDSPPKEIDFELELEV